MFLTVFVTQAIAVLIATVLLTTLGHRLQMRSRTAALAGGLLLAVACGEAVSRAAHLSAEPILIAQASVVGATILIVAGRPRWNPVGQIFFATFLAAAVTYVVFAVAITFGGEIGVAGLLASLVLLVLELFALVLSGYFVHEGCDVLCRVQRTRPAPIYGAGYLPKVSLQVPAYNEPPDMLIETVSSLERIDYPNFEILVIDNNTDDPDLWRPVEEYCRDRPRVRFIHEEGVDGFKAGALNLVMREHLDDDVEIIGIVDADYRVDPRFLKDVVGYLADPNVGFVQTPQDYRSYEGDTYLTACYDAYHYFFVTSMPARDQRNSIIFCGTMGLIRRSALEEVGGWPEWCITEDAETSFRLLKTGYSGVYVPQMYGAGIMPLTFGALKGQRFRWAFGGIQILKKHWRSMLPGPRTASNRLSLAQRFDYLMSGFLWFNDLLYLGFSLILLATAAIVLARGSIQLRPLQGAIVLLPGALIASGIVRALWSLRIRAGISTKRSVFAFLNWLSMSWTTSLACLQHLFSSEAAFMRTPKTGKDRTLLAALGAARVETALAVVIWGAGIATMASGRGTVFLAVLFAWQGLVYAASPLMSWLNVRSELSAELERRRSTEHRRQRLAALPAYAGAAAVIAAGIVVFAAGGAITPEGGGDLFARPERRAAGEAGPLGTLADRVEDVADESTTDPRPETPADEPPGEDAPGPLDDAPAATEPPPGEVPATAAPGSSPAASQAPASATPAPATSSPATEPPTQ